jgi:probable HAF family extracellular repeat protein
MSLRTLPTNPRTSPAALAGAAIALGALVAIAGAQPNFRGMGDLPGGQNFSEVWGVSADGAVVVGDSIVSGNVLFGGTYAAFRWDDELGLQDIYNLGGIGTICRSYAVNSNGSVVVGSADYGVLGLTQIYAFVWTSASGTQEIGDLPGGTSPGRAAARGVSGDGQIVAGQGESDNGAEPFRYTRNDATWLGLGDLPGGTFGGSAYGMSGDGQTIVGSSIAQDGTHAFRWTQSDGMADIGHLPVPPGIDPFAEAYAANSNGMVIVGLSRSLASSNAGWEAFRWTQATGMVGLGDLPGGAVLSEAYAMTADGSVVVGKAGVAGQCGPFGCQTQPRAFIWDAQHGMRDLNVLLPSMGLNTLGWVLTEARGISANGRVIVGNGIAPSGDNEGWRADLGVALTPTCGSADFNHDGDSATDLDIEDFFRCIAGDCCASCDSADFNYDGDSATDADIEAFFRVLAGGNC